MADILQYGKRGGYLPRAMGGYITMGEVYGDADGNRERERGVMPPMMQTLSVTTGAHPNQIEYQIRVTEDEALRIAGKWLSDISTRRTRDAIKAEQAKRNAGVSI